MSKQIIVTLDPQEDLCNAGLCYCDACAEAFAERYKAHAESYAEAQGLEIEVVVCGSDTPEWYRHRHENDDDERLAQDDAWQAIHDRFSWGADDRPVGCETLTEEEAGTEEKTCKTCKFYKDLRHASREVKQYWMNIAGGDLHGRFVLPMKNITMACTEPGAEVTDDEDLAQIGCEEYWQPKE